MPKRRKHRGRNWIVYHPQSSKPSHRVLLYAVLAMVVIYGLVWVLGYGWNKILGLP